MHTVPYTYLLKFVHPDTGATYFYYGVRYKQGCTPADFFVSYFTSSLIIEKWLKEFGVIAFSHEIRGTFSSKAAAVKWEAKVLRRMHVLRRPDFVNQSISGTKFCCLQGHPHTEESRRRIGESNRRRSPITGWSQTEDACRSISAAKKGWIPSENTRKAMSKAKIGKAPLLTTLEKAWASTTGCKRSAETRLKMSLAMKGKNIRRPSEETRTKMRAAHARRAAQREAA